MGTGENEQALRKIMDFTRMLSIAILIIHIYLSCYILFKEIGFSSTIADKILVNISKTIILKSMIVAKLTALLLLLISLLGSKGG